MENDKIDKNNILKLNIPQEFNLKDIKNKKLQKIHDQAIQKYLKAKDIKELDDVILMLNRVVTSDKDNVIAMYNLAVCYSDIKNFDKSIELFEKVINKLENDKKNSLYESSLYNLANQYIYIKEYEKALSLLESILKENPKSWDSLYNAGYLCMRYLNDYDKAIKYFDILLKSGSMEKNCIYNLGISYMLKGDLEKSVDTFEYLIRISPEFSIVYYNLGYLYSKLNQNDKAYFYYEKFINSSKSLPQEYYLSKIARRRIKEFQINK